MTDPTGKRVSEADSVDAVQARSLAALKESIGTPYFDDQADAGDRGGYYSRIDLSADVDSLREQLSALVSDTHERLLEYSPSEHLYPWVDHQPDGHLNNIYSATRVDPEAVIRDDARIARARADKLVALVRARPAMSASQAHLAVQEVGEELHFNCEHVVPQSWFGHDEPMRGDLHHLFTCEPKCNARRGNIPYSDLAESGVPIQSCGRVQGDVGFEPLAGKGAVARATMYFLLRYPGLIGDRVVELQRGTLPTLAEWSRDDPVGLYEQHRNASIRDAQGNRNPFVDFPDLVGRLDLSSAFGLTA